MCSYKSAANSLESLSINEVKELAKNLMASKNPRKNILWVLMTETGLIFLPV